MRPQLSHLQIFHKYVPVEAVRYCYHLWLEHPFALKITPHRSTKLGDYRYSTEKGHQISVNSSLNPYAFLITYLHEVAHMVTYSRYKRQVKPHGPEWKGAFQQLMQPVMLKTVFPEAILMALQQYLTNPKASSCADPQLMTAIRTFDAQKEGYMLQELQMGERFRLSGRVFVKGSIRRTRVMCEEPATRKKYLVAVQAVVEKID